MLTGLSIDEPKNIKKRYPKIEFIKYDGDIFPFDNKTFDICWSNAVLEHVGDRKKQILFLKEITRVGKNISHNP